jgi:hypothetical protein
MIEEIHRGCGGVIMSGTYLTYPATPFRRCTKCGAEEVEERPQIIRREVDLNGGILSPIPSTEPK